MTAPKKDNLVSYQEVQRHSTQDDCWMIIHGKVYDLTRFLPEHPGGKRVLLNQAGMDGTEAFQEIHSEDVIARTLPADAFVGILDQKTFTGKAHKQQATPEELLKKAEKMMPLSQVINLYDFEFMAKKTMKPEAWNYYSSGSDDEMTLRENCNAFQRVWLVPRVMVDVSQIDFRTTILGYPCEAPFYMTATALGRLGHPEGEVALTRAAGQHGIIHMLPTLSSCSLDEMTAARMPEQTQFFQLYVNRDRATTARIIKQAEARGCKALFITVDAPTLGNREKDMRTKFTDEPPTEMKGEDVQRNRGAARAIGSFIDPGLSWKDIPWFRSTTCLPLVLKGIQCAADAVLAAQHGIEGIVLSNHGGRQLETARSGLEILPDVMRALDAHYKTHPSPSKPRMEVYIDGGVRRATDIVKALALGARAVGIGRPFLYAMGGYGQKGVEKAMQVLKDELHSVMQLMGAPTLKDITADMVDVSSLGLHTGAPIRNYLAEKVYEPLKPPELSKL
ncbi:cytochrome b2 [Powellomyces hirtus]|nr:cytochrome b2 [Powellomyces hirtus]